MAVCCVSKMFSHLNGDGDFWKTEAFPSVTITHGHRCRPQGVAMTGATEEKVRVIKDTCRPRGSLGLAGAEFPWEITQILHKEGKSYSVGWIQTELDPVFVL